MQWFKLTFRIPPAGSNLIKLTDFILIDVTVFIEVIGAVHSHYLIVFAHYKALAGAGNGGNSSRRCKQAWQGNISVIESGVVSR